MSDFRWLDHRAIDPNAAYDAFALQRLLNNTNHVFEQRGNHVGYQWDPRTTDVESKHFRPFCSVTKWLTILRIPYYISPGLKMLKCSLLSRVSNAELEVQGDKSKYQSLPLSIRLTIDTDTTGSGGATLTPRVGFVGSNLQSLWGWDTFEYQVGAEILSSFGGSGGMTYLNLEIQSQTPAQVGDLFTNSSGNDHGYVLSSWSLRDSSGGDLMVSNQSGFFAEGSAPTAPTATANEGTALAVLKKREDTEFRLTGIYDHAFRYPSTDNTMMRVDGSPFVYSGEQWGMKIAASYIQPVTFEISEVYQ